MEGIESDELDHSKEKCPVELADVVYINKRSAVCVPWLNFQRLLVERLCLVLLPESPASFAV